ncbi:MAG TPA: OadG family protein [Myxococcota bacterium]|nr:OadG family protein [Myxococcota bacterium]
MLSQGVELMAVGMTTVFAFLLLLVGLMYISAAVFARWPDDEPPDPEAPDEDLVAIAIALAAIQHKRDQ